MSKLLKRALKTAIFPASLMIVGKLVTILTLVSSNSMEFSVSNDSPSIFSVQLVLSSQSDVVFVNSISNFVALILIAIPTFYMLIRRTLLIDIQSNPRTVVKLTRLNILKWVTSQENPLVTITIWTLFLWIIAGITISSSVMLQTYSWIAITAGILAILSAWGLLRTFELETAKIYPKDNNGYL